MKPYRARNHRVPQCTWSPFFVLWMVRKCRFRFEKRFSPQFFSLLDKSLAISAPLLTWQSRNHPSHLGWTAIAAVRCHAPTLEARGGWLPHVRGHTPRARGPSRDRRNAVPAFGLRPPAHCPLCSALHGYMREKRPRRARPGRLAWPEGGGRRSTMRADHLPRCRST